MAEEQLTRYRVSFPKPPRRDPNLIAMFPWARSPGEAVALAKRLLRILPPGTFAKADRRSPTYPEHQTARSSYERLLRAIER